ncbi:MAG: hypothetical protein V4721_05710 [Bacteroidota bacterium]
MLLAILLLSFSLPLFPLISVNLEFKGIPHIMGTAFNEASSASLIKGREVGKFDDEVQLMRLSGIVTSLIAFYLCAILFFLLKFAGQISNVMALVRTSERTDDGNTSFLDPQDNIPAFSFFNHIVVNKTLYGEEDLTLIIAHEKAHASQFHSMDIIAAEIASVILLGNPMVTALKDSIRMNLEFLADKQVIREGYNKKAYQWSIIKPYLHQNSYPLTNLYSSKPKQRIERMNAVERPLINLLKYAFIIPVVALIYTAVIPFHATALDKISTMKSIKRHDYHDYLGYYEFERDKGSFVQIMMKDEALVMNTLWNNKKIYFQRQSENSFLNTEGAISLTFPRNFEGSVTGLVAFGDDRWTKVQKYTPVEKKSGEGTVISRTASGGMQVMVYAIEPWSNVKNYTTRRAEFSP